MDRIGGGPAVRRGLLTSAGAPLAPVTVGNATDTVAGLNTQAVMWDNYNPAATTGVLNTVTLQNSGITASYAFFTINSSGVITDISATITTDLSSVSGTTNSVSLASPLAINAGDFIGIWFDAGTGGIRFANVAAGFSRKYIASPIAKPSIGATLTADATTSSTHWLIAATT